MSAVVQRYTRLKAMAVLERQHGLLRTCWRLQRLQRRMKTEIRRVA